jgi:hypothetical protein
VTRDVPCGSQGESAREHGNAPKDHALSVGEKIVAPVQCGVQGLVACRSRSAPRPTQSEFAVEKRSRLGKPIRIDPPGGEFQGKRQSPELPTHAGDDRRVCIGEVPRLTAHTSALQKKTGSGKGANLGKGEIEVDRWALQCWELVDAFAFNAQRFAGCHQNMQIGDLGEQSLRQASRFGDQMLGAVEDEERPLPLKAADECRNRITRVNWQPE